jgi:hypothetical protein
LVAGDVDRGNGVLGDTIWGIGGAREGGGVLTRGRIKEGAPVAFALRQRKMWGKESEAAAGDTCERRGRPGQPAGRVAGRGQRCRAGGDIAYVEAGEGTRGWGVRLGGLDAGLLLWHVPL